MTVVAVAAAVVVVSVVLAVVLFWQAPDGWEDEDGFHLGQQP